MIKIENARIFTMNRDFDVIDNGSVLIDGEKIVEIKRGKIDRAAEKTYDFHGDVLMPAFVNAHTHSAMTLFRSGADDLPLLDWLHHRIFPLEDNLTPEHMYWGAYLAFAEYVAGGTATIADMYFYPETMLEAVKKCGITCVSVAGATDFGSQAEEELETLEKRFLELNGKAENFRYMLGAHSEYTTTDKLIDGIVALSNKYRAPVYTHLSETLQETGECTVRNGGLTPALYFHRAGFFENGATLAHCVHVDKDDLDVFKQCGVNVVTNPASNLKLASGIAPLYAMRERGINVAIGTDGAASNNALSMFREMYLSSVLAKCSMGDASVLSAEEVLKMATVNGAKALFLNDRGVVEKGKRADLIRVDLNKPHFYPRNNIAKHLVYSAGEGDVKMTMAGGKILYEDGCFHIGEQIEKIYEKAEFFAKDLFKKAGFEA